MSIAIIINPISGGARPTRRVARAALAADSLTSSGEGGEVFVTERKGHARELAAAAVARGARLIVAWGGDGTINEVASALAFGHDAARASCRPARATVWRASSASRDGPSTRSARGARAPRRARSTPASWADGCSSTSPASASTRTSRRCFDRDPTGRRGLASYARITVRELLGVPAGDATASTRRGSRDGQALLVTLANGSQFGNGARIAPGARLDDGQLDLVVFEETSRLRDVRGAAAAVREPRDRDARSVDRTRSSGRRSKAIGR